ncbi:hypothetical protein ABZY44_10065 [Streptomyces sp. NPDC006544]|uniref:hypothetical protein n=1 Tax=Streptomyces sp. NPDC006544 TaxID=3154583 RepID=UPI0033B6FE31
MTSELTVTPRDEMVASELSEAHGWDGYAAELRDLVLTAIEASGVDTLEVSELLVGEPLPDKYSGIRNGLNIAPTPAVELVLRMVAGYGPYCRLVNGAKLHIQTGWDGAVYLYMAPEASARLMEWQGDASRLEWASVGPDLSEVSKPVDTVADDAFWASVAASTGGLVLLCERWAHGSHGCRWFLVTEENIAEIAETVRPRSLLSAVADPDLGSGPHLVDADFTAFRSPLLPGELAYLAYPGGIDDPADELREGYSLALRDSVPAEWCAVVPDSDGVARGVWEDPRDV